MRRQSDYDRFIENMEALENYDGLVSTDDNEEICLEPDNHQSELLLELDKQLNALENETDWLTEHEPQFSFDLDSETTEFVPLDKRLVSRYDRLFIQRVKVEKLIETYKEEPSLVKVLQAKHAMVEKQMTIELDRSLNDKWRRRRDIDEWRFGEGRSTYNESRRKTRLEPNTMTPEEVLATETPEEKKIRVRAQKAKSARKIRAKMTDEQRAAEAERKRLSRRKKSEVTDPAAPVDADMSDDPLSGG